MMRILHFPNELFRAMSRQANEDFLVDLRIANTPSSILRQIESAANNITDAELDKIELSLLQQKSPSPILKMKSRLATPQRMRNLVAEILLKQAQASLEARYPKGLNLTGCKVRDSLRRKVYTTICHGNVTDVLALTDEEWALLEPHWTNDGQHTWSTNSIAACVALMLRDEVFNRVECVDG